MYHWLFTACGKMKSQSANTDWFAGVVVHCAVSIWCENLHENTNKT